jgi:three-Cys-motif partner protein
MTPEGGRTWGYWTQLKLAMLRDYLSRFAVASKAQPERIYLDAFAGEGSGRDRLTGEEFHGSARIALDIDDGSGFTRFRGLRASMWSAQCEFFAFERGFRGRLKSSVVAGW